MNVRKIIEEEINKLLEAEDAPAISIKGEEEEKPATAKKITIGSINKPLEYDEFKEREKGINSPADVYYLAPAGKVGTKSENDTIVLAHYIEGGKWEKSDVTGKTRKDIKKYSYKPKKPRPEVLELQKLMNKWLASKLNPSPYAFRGMGKSKRSEVNEDGYWGPLSQEGLDHIRSIDKNVPKEGSGIPKILAYFKSIENQMVPLATGEKPTAKPQGEVIPVATPAVPPAEPVPSAAATGPEKQGTINTPFKSGEELTQYVQALVAQDKRDMLKGQKLYYMDGTDKYVIPFDENGKMTSPTKIGNLTPQPPRFTGAGEGRLGPQQESKSLRGMILKEILAALK